MSGRRIAASESTAATVAKRARPGVAFVLVNTALMWLTTAVAAAALWPIYRSPQLVVVVVVAILAGSLVAILGAANRWPSYVVLLATIVAFTVVGVPAAVPTQALFGVLPSLGGLANLYAAVALGWKQLLTIELPVGTYQALLVPSLVLVLATAVIALTIALRARRRELALIAPILLFVLATAFGPRYPDRPLALPIALVVTVLGWLVWMRWYRRRRAVRILAARSGAPDAPPGETGLSGLRTAVSAGLILVVASVTGLAAVSAAPPTANRTVLRTAIEQPFDPRAYVSPLSGFRGYLRPEQLDGTLFQVTGLPAGGLIRVATLDSYDGVVYSVVGDRAGEGSSSFVRVPSDVDQSGIDGTQVSVVVQIDGYRGVWLPTVGAFESIAFSGSDAASLRDRFYYNGESGTAAVLGGLSQGDSYSLTAVLPAILDPSKLGDLTPGSVRLSAPDKVPDELTARVERYAADIGRPGERLAAVVAGLQRDGYISHGIAPAEPVSRSGHAADRIAQLFTDPRMIGDAEQYAVAAALMADSVGFPARVVFGFAPTSDTVRGKDVYAWIEVDTAQQGWVAIDPNPAVRPIPEEVPQENTRVSRPQTVVPPPVEETDPLDRQTTPDSQQALPPDLNVALQTLLAIARVLGWVLLAASIALAPFVVIIAAKLRRRRIRRRARDPQLRVLGGWQEFQDSVIDHGLAPAASATRSEIARLTGGTQSQVLAAVADRATFSTDLLEASDADTVWHAVDELQSKLDAGLTRWQRVRAQVSVRSFGGYSVSRLFRR